jgi:arginase family enzyme
MSTLRARCPDCRTLTAVAIGLDYQCHSCGREFAAGLVRVPKAWGDASGETMAEAAHLPVPWPEAATIDEETLEEQIAVMGRQLPARPLVLGGCCCSHIGAVRELARHGRIGLVWIDAHGDLNTPESSPSGNAWGMPLRMMVDGGDVAPEDVTLLGARNLDPPEAEFVARAGIATKLGILPERIYVAVDADVAEPGELDMWMPEPDGMSLEELESLLASLPQPAGAGLAGFLATARNEVALARLGHALGL